MTGAIAGAGTSYPSASPEFTLVFVGSCCSIFRDYHTLTEMTLSRQRYDPMLTEK